MKKHVALSLLIALAASGPALAGNPPASDERPVAERADAQAERISSDTPKYLAELDASIAMANKGQYGKLSRGSGERLAAARQTIGNLLQGDIDPRSLPPEDRLALFNAHQEIESIIKKNDKSRIVCTREQQIGSRVATTSCMTVGEREEIAQRAARGTDSMQRNVCTPGPGMACTK
jgi:exonuclease VII small subunit